MNSTPKDLTQLFATYLDPKAAHAWRQVNKQHARRVDPLAIAAFHAGVDKATQAQRIQERDWVYHVRVVGLMAQPVGANSVAARMNRPLNDYNPDPFLKWLGIPLAIGPRSEAFLLETKEQRHNPAINAYARACLTHRGYAPDLELAFQCSQDEYRTLLLDPAKRSWYPPFFHGTLKEARAEVERCCRNTSYVDVVDLALEYHDDQASQHYVTMYYATQLASYFSVRHVIPHTRAPKRPTRATACPRPSSVKRRCMFD